MAQRPVYIDVYTEMLRDIQTGLYPENSLFPPEEKLYLKAIIFYEHGNTENVLRKERKRDNSKVVVRLRKS